MSESNQGAALGNNQALQVGAEAISGLVSGALAAVFISLPLYILAICSLLGAVLYSLYAMFYHKKTS